MATVVLQVLVDVPDLGDDTAQAISHEVKQLLTNTGEYSADFALQFGVTEVNVVFEDVI